MLTIALTSSDGEAVDVPADFAFHVPESDRSGAHELHLATYHMLWGAGPHRAQPSWDRRGFMSTECHDEVCITCSDQLLAVLVTGVDHDLQRRSWHGRRFDG